MRISILSMAALALGSGVQAQNVLDSFESGTNAGGWSFGGPNEFISPTGGNAGGYVRTSGLDTTIPWVGCAEGSPFAGDLKARGVYAVIVDVNVLSTDFNIGAFPLSLILVSDNGTPGNSDDDWGLYWLGANIPAPGTGWKHISFNLLTQGEVVPPGSHFIQFGPGSPGTPDWSALISNVSRMEFSFGDPSLFYIFQQWTVGADNIGLQTIPPCYANCDLSTAQPLLTANDFQCFLGKFAAGTSSANCDGSTAAPILNINDFQCFINKFAAGCP